jgi:parallel beta-helix repeat protein
VDVVRVDGARLLRNTLQRNGRIGAQLSNGSDGCGGKARTAHVTVRGNKVIGNNTEHFEHSGVAGGLKLGGLAALEVRGNSVRANAGHGIWVDSCSDDVTIVDNVVRSNTDSGITFEISTDGLLADNVVFRNGNHGLFIASSSHVDVWNNTVVDNPQGQIWVVRQLHRDPPGNETSGITIRNTSFSQTSDAWGSSLAATTMGSSETYRALSQMGVTADHDAYWQGGTACPPATADLPAVAGQTVYCTLAEVVAGLGLEANGVEARGGGNPFLVNPARGDFRIPTDRSPSSPALCGGEPLPDEVASAIGPPAVADAAVRIGAFVARQTGAC